MDMLLKAAEQKLKQEPTAEISNDGQNNLSYGLGMVAWEIRNSLSILDVFLSSEFVFKSHPRAKFAQITFIISVCARVYLAGSIKALDSSITDRA